jgi:hypothetical protein
MSPSVHVLLPVADFMCDVLSAVASIPPFVDRYQLCDLWMEYRSCIQIPLLIMIGQRSWIRRQDLVRDHNWTVLIADFLPETSSPSGFLQKPLSTIKSFLAISWIILFVICTEKQIKNSKCLSWSSFGLLASRAIVAGFVLVFDVVSWRHQRE